MPHIDQLTRWVEDAYGMESLLIDALTEQLPRLSGHSEMEAKILEHLERTHGHLNMLDECIARLGGEASSLRKGGLSTFLHGMMSRWITGPHGTLVKLCIGDFAAEHYEIATYTMLITAAQVCRDKETVRVCQQILPDEEEMARWLEEHIVTFSHQVARAQDMPEEEEHGQAPVDAAGRLRHNYLYAVFDSEDQAKKAEQALLGEMGVQALRLQGQDAAAHLRGEYASIRVKLERFVIGLSADAEHSDHYATQLEMGRIVLGVPCETHDMAEKMTQKILDYGAHDIRYFGTIGMVSMGT
jgi:ferritin-like metal-binding protein YciE